MKLRSVITLLVFIAGVAWVMTRSEEGVRQIQRGYYAVLSPFLKNGSSLKAKISAFNEEIESSEQLKSQLSLAETELAQLQIEAIHLRKVEAENRKLRAALQMQQASPFRVLMSHVMRRKPSTWWQTMMIDRGQKHHVEAQFPVLNAQGLIGKVDQSYFDTSTVILLTDEKCQVSAKVQGTQEVGILSGERAQSGASPMLRLRYLSKEAKIQPGAVVMTTGRGGLFPGNIVLGTVVSSEVGAIDTEALVKPVVDFTALDTVFVVLGKKAP